jgi:carotenoid cleavage dioxygenase-like enzyme
MPLFLRALQNPGDKTWSCRQGTQVWDAHPHLDEAVEHLREIGAALNTPALIIAHHMGGRIEHLEHVGPPDP